MTSWNVVFCAKVSGTRESALELGDKVTMTRTVAKKDILIEREGSPVIARSTLTGGIEHLSFEGRQHGYRGEVRCIALPTVGQGEAEVLFGFLGCKSPDCAGDENEDTEVFVATKPATKVPKGPPPKRESTQVT